MRKVLLITSAVLLGWAAYSAAPDICRYWKLRSM